MFTMAKGALKSKMLEVFRHVEQTGEELIVTDHSKPVLKVIPIYKDLVPENVFGDLAGKLIEHEDINTPTQSEWTDV